MVDEKKTDDLGLETKPPKVKADAKAEAPTPAASTPEASTPEATPEAPTTEATEAKPEAKPKAKGKAAKVQVDPVGPDVETGLPVADKAVSRMSATLEKSNFLRQCNGIMRGYARQGMNKEGARLIQMKNDHPAIYKKYATATSEEIVKAYKKKIKRKK